MQVRRTYRDPSPSMCSCMGIPPPVVMTQNTSCVLVQVQTANAKTTNAAYCHACVPPEADAKATLVLDKQELVHAHNFIIEHLPHNPLDYDHPLAKNEWLAALAKKVPYVKPCEAPNGERLSYSLDEYKIAVAEIKSYHNNPFTAVEEMKESVDQVMKGLRSSKGKYPRLHPFALHGHEHVLQLLMLALCANEPKMFKIDKVSSTLAFFSADGSVTDWHFDWTEARNVALGVEVSDGSSHMHVLVIDGN